MRKIRLSSILSLLVALAAFAGSCRGNHTDAVVETIDTLPVMASNIRQCARLYTAEYVVRKIVTHNDELTLDGSIIHHDFSVGIPLGKRRIAIPIEATVKAYIDFAGFTERNIRRDGNRIEIILPDPQISLTATRIDHQAIRQYVALMRRNFSDEELSVYERQGRQAIIDDIAHMGIIATARHSAAATLIPLVSQMGYEEKDITITFRKDFGIKDIPSLIINKKID